MKNQIQDYVRRPGRYSNIDGTGEMLFGVMFLSFALYNYLQSLLPADSIWRGKNWHQLVFMTAVLLPVLRLGRLGAKAIKKHITFPRTGYVAYKRSARSVAMITAAGVAAVISAAFAFAVRFGVRYNAASLLAIGEVILYAAPYVALALISRDHSWKWFVALLMILGLAGIAFEVPGSWPEQFRRPFFFLGVTWLASGGITLYLYIRRTQPPNLETEPQELR